MKLRTIGMAAVAALALVAGRAEAQDAGWDTKYGILFTLPNLLQNGSSQVIDDYSGRVGFQYNLAPTAGIRVSADLSRFSEGARESTDALGIVTKPLPVITSIYGIDLGAQYMLRFGTAAVAPYAGVGASIGFTQSARKGDHEPIANVITEYDNFDRSWDFGVDGTIGLEWRVHKVISLFAEYVADLTLIRAESGESNVTAPASPTVSTSYKEKAFANLSTGIAQGGQLGIIAFF
jgi:hypothetical protein